MTALITGWLASHWLLVAAGLIVIAAVSNPVLVWKLKAWILLAVVAWWGWTGHAAYDALVLKNALDENKALTQAIAENAKANDERRAAERRLDKLAKHQPKVVERVIENPSGCVRPAPVADAVRVQVDAVNDAIRMQPATDTSGKQ